MKKRKWPFKGEPKEITANEYIESVEKIEKVQHVNLKEYCIRYLSSGILENKRDPENIVDILKQIGSYCVAIVTFEDQMERIKENPDQYTYYEFPHNKYYCERNGLFDELNKTPDIYR